MKYVLFFLVDDHVRHGCVLSSWLFNVYIADAMRWMKAELDYPGVKMNDKRMELCGKTVS